MISLVVFLYLFSTDCGRCETLSLENNKKQLLLILTISLDRKPYEALFFVQEKYESSPNEANMDLVICLSSSICS